MKTQIIDYGLNYELKRAHYNDAGVDVRNVEKISIHFGSNEKVRLGFGIKLPDAFAAYVVPRSGLSTLGLSTELAPIDSGYQGEIHAIMTLAASPSAKLFEKDGFSREGDYLVIEPGTRIAQLVIHPIILPDFVKELGEERGKTGFGASGTK